MRRRGTHLVHISRRPWYGFGESFFLVNFGMAVGSTRAANYRSSCVYVWDVELELYCGCHSAINAVPLNATAFAHRISLFTVQFYGSAPPGFSTYPNSGFSFIGWYVEFFFFLFFFFAVWDSLLIYGRIAMVQSATNNSPSNWDFGWVSNLNILISRSRSDLWIVIRLGKIEREDRLQIHNFDTIERIFDFLRCILLYLTNTFPLWCYGICGLC